MLVETEPASRDAVTESTDQGAEVGVGPLISFKSVEAEHDVREMSVAIGYLKGDHAAAVVRDRDRKTVSVPQGEQLRSPIGFEAQ